MAVFSPFIRQPGLALLGLLLFFLATCSAPGSASQPTATVDPLVVQGEITFKQNCATCHAVEPETIIVGPSLAGLAGRAGSQAEGLDARLYIETSILKPSAYLVEGFSDVMPDTFGTRLSGEELDALVAYLLTLD
ncbi:MAG: cytochrome c [Chloroflexi bacterium]|nr:cytochrome c [Chloroflexota bacterium]MCI0574621.1 cytochrome c [Chloroflexota bacterium]MCI0644027.1 cytochrome c [Chloroflexota bacterium]MCI0731701.1 cytochrome c [Chloroflexota bacterium]